MFRIMGLFAVIPVAVLLTISFFVLVTVKKIEGQGLKAFGYTVAALIWAAALLVSSAGIYTLSTGRPVCPMMKMMNNKMPGMMMKDKMPAMMPGMMQKEGCAAKK